ncbi:hypothetical protein LSUE1_G006623 [Lachnellula suecica]|uniref:Uncharacterized protein n=1 Tax=Lachnellula suecica TaxID=602035 RepID=A0A8T9C4V9_9HELO|nr:hypothetical protein LSUE1_G006623 [Lachnellula suecica]
MNPAYPTTLPTITKRALSTDNKINIIIGILTLVIGILSVILAWAMWRLTSDRRRRLHSRSPSPPTSPIELLPIPTMIPGHAPGTNRLGYEVAFRIGRST